VGACRGHGGRWGWDGRSLGYVIASLDETSCDHRPGSRSHARCKAAEHTLVRSIMSEEDADGMHS